MPPEIQQSTTPARRRLTLPRPAALSVTDDAGARHRHQVPRLWFPWVIRERDPASRAVRREQMKTGWDQTTVTLMAFAMMPLVGGFAWAGLKFGLPIYWIYAGALLASAGFAWALWWIAHRRLERHWPSLGRQWTDAGLSRGRCPLCLYSLTGAPADDRDLAQCAECGAAWQHNRIHEVPDRHLPQWRRFVNHMIGAEMRRPLRDDAGRTFAAERLRAIGARLRRREPESAEIVGRVRESSGVARRGLALLFGLLMLAQAILLLRGAAGLDLSPLTLFMLLLTAIFAAIILGAIVCSDLGLTARSRRRQMLAAGLCPVCAGGELKYDEADAGLTTCASCGARWRLPH